ncbi:hypothetical protein COX95_04805 [bacterium CG_4_10_14_0_2_um_filter_33_32]|nr:MAG: hypothetical protein AUJ93_01965 [bacterium CG2_30_33_46]PIU76297.1 MAG: hypothetical protein COS74_04865 [bacterium CG06_land_8_20_14_3_00_33_50]PIW81117.1 MAG: hypothetical protein COZ97_03385 [bacterium CG_4_8_14_3_um_filter_33_28]PIY85628.1 MAG: hypothetical protein COY76_01145 [bacterium CG_4_10_14_0_8_um_filter_33_57]PIZ85233.1 MAG: hypothetical protein COX95_04805 [bacterium CG_4_10_14_0_2_um_filter_33_32]PJA72248.1 MAG: hypothetical protein CO152_02335 [bacterium CG_4_9_14_3_um
MIQNKTITNALKEQKGFLPIIAGCVAGLIFWGMIGIVLVGVGMTGEKSGSSGGGGSGGGGNNWQGPTDTTDTIDGLTLPDTSGKLGNEQHIPGPHNTDNKPATDLSCMVIPQTHYQGSDSNPLTYATTGCGSYHPYTQDQEHWYFNMRWPSSVFKHKKIILTNPQNGKRVVVSIEEYGPAAFKMKQDGINCGAPPEVRNYLQTADANTGDPNDKKGFVQIGFAQDQNIPLGPLPDITPQPLPI